MITALRSIIALPLVCILLAYVWLFHRDVWDQIEGMDI